MIYIPFQIVPRLYTDVSVLCFYLQLLPVIDNCVHLLVGGKTSATIYQLQLTIINKNR